MTRKNLTYKDAGVDIDAGNRTVELLADVVAATSTDHVLSAIGAFGGLSAVVRTRRPRSSTRPSSGRLTSSNATSRPIVRINCG